MTQMCAYFKTKIDVAKNLINKFLTLTVRGPFHRKDFKWKKIWGHRVSFWENGSFYVEINKRAEAASNSYSAPGDFSQYVYSVLVAKNQKKIRSWCLVHEFSFIDINHGYWVAILKKNYLWLLPLFR